MRGATCVWLSRFRSSTFQSTRPVRGATLRPKSSCLGPLISIHAPRAGRDQCRRRCPFFPRHFNPRAPCGARRVAECKYQCSYSNFNPRAPCGARPRNIACRIRLLGHFNPRAPCGARLRVPIIRSEQYLFQSTRPVRGATGIDIHKLNDQFHFNPRAPCGARRVTTVFRARVAEFQSTRPVRGATLRSDANTRGKGISIHAPRAGRDISVY